MAIDTSGTRQRIIDIARLSSHQNVLCSDRDRCFSPHSKGVHIMRKIALVRIRDWYDHDSESRNLIAQSITDWVEVPESDYQLLLYYQKDGWSIVEQPLNQQDAVVKTVEDAIKIAKRRKKQEDEAKAKAEEKKLQAKLKREAKTKEQREKLFMELKREFEENTYIRSSTGRAASSKVEG